MDLLKGLFNDFFLPLIALTSILAASNAFWGYFGFSILFSTVFVFFTLGVYAIYRYAKLVNDVSKIIAEEEKKSKS